MARMFIYKQFRPGCFSFCTSGTAPASPSAARDFECATYFLRIHEGIFTVFPKIQAAALCLQSKIILPRPLDPLQLMAVLTCYS